MGTVAGGTSLMQQAKERLRDGKLTGYACGSCDHIQSTLIVVCPKDGGRDIKVADLPETGEIASYTIQHISSEEYINDIPFAFVVVKLDNGVSITGWVADVYKPEELPIGTKVRFVQSYKPGVQFEKA